MLQDITVNSFNNVNQNINKTYLYLFYKELQKQQANLNLHQFYFDDNFYWDKTYVKCKKDKISTMINGKDYYGYNLNIKSEKTKKCFENFISYIKQHYQWADKRKTDLYINIILNKLRPTKELDKILQEEKRNKQIKQVKKNNNKILKNAYIYKIVIDNELVYIGKTYRDLKNRLGEHIECSLNKSIKNSQQKYLYEAMRNAKYGYKFVILYESHNEIDNHELEEKEKIFIETFKPKFNYEGVKVPYRFSKY